MGVMEQILEQLQEINSKLDNMETGSDTEQKLLNAEIAAERLSVSKGKIYELIKQDKIPNVSIGHRTLIPNRELENWISQQAAITEDNKDDVLRLEA